LVSEKVKVTLEKIGMGILAIGIATPLIFILTIFVDPSIFERYWVVVVGVGIGVGVLGCFIWGVASALKATPPKELVKRIVDYAVPILESKGKVSFHDIATHLGVDVSDVDDCIHRMIIEGSFEGYFENVTTPSGWLVKVARLCKYCGTEVQPGARKCPNCGAVIKK